MLLLFHLAVVSNAFFPRLNHQHRSFELRQLLDMWLQCPLVSMRIAQNEIVLHSFVAVATASEPNHIPTFVRRKTQNGVRIET